MRKWINLIESVLPQFVYHGTCVENWAITRVPPSSNLYVTSSRLFAVDYAEEWAVSDDTPILVTIPLSAFSEDRFLPNEETLMQHEEGHVPIDKPTGELTWRDTFQFNGTFVITNFSEADKLKCTVTPVQPS